MLLAAIFKFAYHKIYPFVSTINNEDWVNLNWIHNILKWFISTQMHAAQVCKNVKYYSFLLKGSNAFIFLRNSMMFLNRIKSEISPFSTLLWQTTKIRSSIFINHSVIAFQYLLIVSRISFFFSNISIINIAHGC